MILPLYPPIIPPYTPLIHSLIHYPNKVVFFDNCREGQHPLAGHICRLQRLGRLPPKWTCIAAPSGYSPLGQMSTFISYTHLLQHFKVKTPQ